MRLNEIFDGIEKRERSDARAELRASGHGSNAMARKKLPPEIAKVLKAYVDKEKPRLATSWKPVKFDDETGKIRVQFKYSDGGANFKAYKVDGDKVTEIED
jgi:hypothetical protein